MHLIYMVCLSAVEELKKIAFELHILRVLIFKAEAVYAFNFNVPLLSLFLAGMLAAFPTGL